MNSEEIESAIKHIMAHAQGALDPSADQLRTLLSGNLEGPFHFVNLLSFRSAATYPETHNLAGHHLSGAEAYDKYGIVALEHVTKRGGRLVTLNAVETQVIGSPKSWDRVATMEYQDIHAFIDMLMDPSYLAALVHREAGLEATEVFATRPLITEPIG